MLRSLTSLAVGAAVLAAAAPATAQSMVSWETLAQVRLVRDGARFEPRFEPTVQRLNGQRVRVQGFMLPLSEGSGAQQHFVLSAAPVANCFYCMPGGPESMIEVRATRSAITSSPCKLRHPPRSLCR